MAEFITNLPPVPDNDYSDYIIYTYNDNYYLTVFDTLETGSINEQGSLFYDSTRELYVYDSNSGEWLLNDTFWRGSYTLIGADGYNAINSSVDIYNPDGTIFCYGDKSSYINNIPLISGTLSGSVFSSVLGEIWTVTPFLIIAIVALFGFRKAWSFLHGLIRGA